MSPADLARHHPRLYHVAAQGALSSIMKFGLLPTVELVKRCNLDATTSHRILKHRRPSSVSLVHTDFGKVEISDNSPLSEAVLTKCLDDGLLPSDWMMMLNSRVFLFPHEAAALSLTQARLNMSRIKTVIAVDTFSFASRYADQMEICPINSGSTIRKAARRGLNTFSPLQKYSYAEWRKLRGQSDTIKEVSLITPILDFSAYVVSAHHVRAGSKIEALYDTKHKRNCN
jgi:hypothetical protein